MICKLVRVSGVLIGVLLLAPRRLEGGLIPHNLVPAALADGLHLSADVL